MVPLPPCSVKHLRRIDGACSGTALNVVGKGLHAVPTHISSQHPTLLPPTSVCVFPPSTINPLPLPCSHRRTHSCRLNLLCQLLKSSRPSKGFRRSATSFATPSGSNRPSWTEGTRRVKRLQRTRISHNIAASVPMYVWTTRLPRFYDTTSHPAVGRRRDSPSFQSDAAQGSSGREYKTPAPTASRMMRTVPGQTRLQAGFPLHREIDCPPPPRHRTAV